ncbi:MAG: aldehyde dehydrogenase [Lachnospiraceae bacterium]|nr:aldehyde dehydrogenase [Lachnospiraceae bacterium]
MSKPKVLLNGFGRIGRAILRINLEKQLFDIVTVNVINPDNKNIAYLIKYDSTYGVLPNEVTNDDSSVSIDGAPIRITHEADIRNVDLTGIDYVIEATGVKSNILWIEENAANSAVKRFITTNIESKKSQNIIFGVNQEVLLDRSIKNISSSICDAISLGPVYRVLSEHYDIESGFLVTLHPWLSYQNLLDGPAKSWSQPGDIYSHYALGRASTQSLIPKSTSAIRALNNVFPGALDKVCSFSYRTPTPIVSGAVLTLKLKQDTDAHTLVGLFQEEEAKQTHHIIKTTDEPLVSMDYIRNDYSTILDTRWIQVNNRNHIELVYWYDNEWGYSSRVCDIIAYMAEIDF